MSPPELPCAVAAAALAAFLACGAFPAGGGPAPPEGGAEAHYRKAMALLGDGRQREAAAEMMSAILDAPAAPAAPPPRPAPRAMSHYREGLKKLATRYDSLAEDEFKKAVDCDPEMAAPRYQLAFIAGNRGQYDAMFRHLWRASREGTSKVERSRALAGLALLARKPPEAVRYYRQALAADPKSAEAMRMLGLLLVQSGERREGMGLLETALRERPDDYSTLSALGLANMLNGEYPRAEEYLSRAIGINGEHPEARGRLGVALLLEGRTDEAVARLNEAVKACPGNAELQINLGKAYKLAGKPEEAERCFTGALKADQGNAEGWYELGNLLSMQERLDRALEAYRKAAAVDPGFARAYYKRGLILAGRKAYGEAEDEFKKALRADCDCAEAYYALAILSREFRKDSRAAAHYCRMYLLYDKSSDKAKEAVRWLKSPDDTEAKSHAQPSHPAH